MRRLLVLAIVAGLGGATSSSALAASQPFSAHGSGSLSKQTCSPGYDVCKSGSGSLTEARFGAGTFTMTVRIKNTTTPCTGGTQRTLDSSMTMTFGSKGSVSLTGTGSDCATPTGSSGKRGTYSVTGGTGSFKGAAGSGSLTATVSGSTLSWTLDGTIALTAPPTTTTTATTTATTTVAVTQSTVQVSAGSGGSVQISPGGVTCAGPRTCPVTVANGTHLTLKAVPDSRHSLSEWQGVCTSRVNTTCSLTVKGPAKVSVFFKQRDWLLTVTATGGGRVTSSPTGIDCPGRCSAKFGYATGRNIRLAAQGGANATFGGWTGGTCRGTSPTCSFSISSDTTVNAVFTPKPVTLSVSVTGQGKVTGSGIDCGTQCYATFRQSGYANLTATPATGWKFDHWTGACATVAAKSASCQLRISVPNPYGPQTTAVFVRR